MIKIVGHANTYYNNRNLNKNNSIKTISQDSVSFKGKAKFVDNDVLTLVKKLEKSQPIIGFKGDGIWVLPNLRQMVGQRFNMYLPDGKQISYQKGVGKNNVIFSLKTNTTKEISSSKIKLPEKDINNDYKKLLKTKSEHFMTFRVNTKDAKPYQGDFKEGQIDKIIMNPDKSYSETTQVSDKEHKEINDILRKYLPSFF